MIGQCKHIAMPTWQGFDIETCVHSKLQISTKITSFKLLKPNFDIFTVVSISYMTIEHIYGTILPIFKELITLLKVIPFLRKFIFRLMIVSLLYTDNLK